MLANLFESEEKSIPQPLEHMKQVWKVRSYAQDNIASQQEKGFRKGAKGRIVRKTV